MSSEEAIKVLQNEVACVKAGVCSLRCTKCKLFVTDEQVLTAHEMSISALRAQQELESNPPLTLDELRQMYMEPVWVVVPDFSAEWRILACVETRSQEKAVLFMDGSHEPLTEYGKKWLAYRHKAQGTTITCTATNQPCAMCQPVPCGSRKEAHNGSN